MIARGWSFGLRLVALTSFILTLVFFATGILLRKSISDRANRTVEREIVESFLAYEALWQEHTHYFETISSLISRMADVRAAFLTNDQATIRDTAGELWARIASGGALLTIADGNGRVIASVGAHPPFALEERLSFIPSSRSSFPQQRTGFLRQNNRLFQIVLTPVYVDASEGRQLLSVLVTGFELDKDFLHGLKAASAGSELIFKMAGAPLASTVAGLPQAKRLEAACSAAPFQTPQRATIGPIEYMVLRQPLPVLTSSGQAELCIARSLANAQGAVAELQSRTVQLWLAALVGAILGTYLIVRKMLKPVSVLDRAASEIAKGNYHIRVEAKSDDELGRLARSFNAMCQSLEQARAELIRHERLESVARLATVVVHDLRNPLASIYAGAEMLVDNDLNEKQVKRLARNMYAASRGVMEILTELLSTARKQTPELEPCNLRELITTEWNALAITQQGTHIQFECDVPADLEVVVDRGPMERVFHNLLENATEAIGMEGKISISVEMRDSELLLHIRDTGRGIDPELRSILFQPFASKGRAGGLGLGLALSRQTVLAHGGDLSADFECGSGSHFILRLPFQVTRETAHIATRTSA